MQIGIVGSRRRKSFFDRKTIFDLVSELKERNENLVLVSGGCRQGADFFAEEAAKVFGVRMVVLPVWKQGDTPIKDRFDFTQRAYTRNFLIAEHSSEIYALVAPDRTGGTENTIEHAHDLNRRVFIHCEYSSGWIEEKKK